MLQFNVQVFQQVYHLIKQLFDIKTSCLVNQSIFFA